MIRQPREMRRRSRVRLRYQFLVTGRNKEDQSQRSGGRTTTGGSSSSGIGRATRRTRRWEITGASSMLGTGGVTTVLPEGNSRTKFPAGVVLRTLADCDPTRRGGSERRTDDLARRWRRDFVLAALESSRFLALATCSDELAGCSLPPAVVDKESFAAVAVRSGTSLFSAGGGPALIAAWLVSECFAAIAVRSGKSAGGDSLFSASGGATLTGA